MKTYNKRRKDKAQENCQRDRYKDFATEVERSNDQRCDSQINQCRTARACELYLIGLFQLRIVFLATARSRARQYYSWHCTRLAAGFNVPERKSFRNVTYVCDDPGQMPSALEISASVAFSASLTWTPPPNKLPPSVAASAVL